MTGFRWPDAFRDRTGPYAYLKLRPGDVVAPLVCGGSKGWGKESGWNAENVIDPTPNSDTIKRSGQVLVTPAPDLTNQPNLSEGGHHG
jgi:hypothetical protein